MNSSVYTYVIVFELSADLNIAAFEQYLKDSEEIIGFWNHIPFVYCIKSRVHSAVLGQKLSLFFSGRKFLIAQIDVSNANGWLPMDAWNWLNHPHTSKRGTLSDVIASLSWSDANSPPKR